MTTVGGEGKKGKKRGIKGTFTRRCCGVSGTAAEGEGANRLLPLEPGGLQRAVPPTAAWPSHPNPTCRPLRIVPPGPPRGWEMVWEAGRYHREGCEGQRPLPSFQLSREFCSGDRAGAAAARTRGAGRERERKGLPHPCTEQDRLAPGRHPQP